MSGLPPPFNRDLLLKKQLRPTINTEERFKRINQPHPEKLTITQLKVFITQLKRKEDGSMPKTKELLIVKLVGWEAGGVIEVEKEVLMVKEEPVMTAVRIAAEDDDNKSDY